MKHAVVSASGASRWLACPPSARLEATLPETESEATKKGILAHEIAELKLRKYCKELMSPSKFVEEMKKFKNHPLYEAEMDKNTNIYFEYIKSVVHSYDSSPYIAIERKVKFDHYVPEGFGTADCIIIGSGQMHIIDYKNGQGVPVTAENNPQMMLYALGAIRAYALLYRVETVHMAIIQPRVREEHSEWSISAKELHEWGESIKPIAKQAFDGKGEYRTGAHCRFCKASERCRVRTKPFMDGAKKYGQSPLLSWEETGQVLRELEGFATWYESLKKKALAEVMQGGDVSGWKAIRGRGSRTFVDTDTAFAHLQANGIDEAMLYERKPLTVSAIEKVLKSEQYKQLLVETGHVTMKQGAPKLVPISDKGEAIKIPSAVDDFGSAIQGGK